MITIAKLIEVQKETERFTASVEKCLIRLEKEVGERYSVASCKETGAVKRASLDLTRALAELRKS